MLSICMILKTQAITKICHCANSVIHKIPEGKDLKLRKVQKNIAREESDNIKIFTR